MKDLPNPISATLDLCRALALIFKFLENCVWGAISVLINEGIYTGIKQYCG